MSSSKNRKVLTLNAGEISYGSFPVLSIERLEVFSSTVIVIKGTNGSGKTSLFRAIAGIQAKSSGDIFLFDRRLNDMAPHIRFRQGIRFIPQDRQVFNRLTFKEHFQIAKNSKFVFKKGSKELPTEFKKVSKLIGNTNKRGISLSGGQVKVMLLLALTQQTPTILMLDEPFAGLDETAKQIVKTVINQCLDLGGACLISDHTRTAELNFRLSSIYKLIAPTNSEYQGKKAPYRMINTSQRI